MLIYGSGFPRYRLEGLQESLQSAQRGQKIRQKKQEKRRRAGRGGGQKGVLEPPEAIEALATHAELRHVRLPEQPLRAELERLSDWIDRSISLRDGLDALPGPLSFALFRAEMTSRLASEEILPSLELGLANVARKSPHLRNGVQLLRMAIRDHRRNAHASHNPLWTFLLDWSLRDLELDAPLRDRAVLLFESSEPCELPSVPTEMLIRFAGCEPDARFDELRRRLEEEETLATSDCYDLLRFLGKLVLLSDGLTETEVIELKARGLLEWARGVAAGRLGPELGERFHANEAELELLLAFLGDRLELDEHVPLTDFLDDPDGPDVALNLARDLGKRKPQEAYRLVQWAVERHPELFDAHLQLGRLALQMGSPEEVEAHVRRCLDELDKQPREYLDDDVREDVLREAESLRTLARKEIESARVG